MVYICQKCEFHFIRVGEVEQCPKCTSQSIRAAVKQEEENFCQLQKLSVPNRLRRAPQLV